jgi:hypothetical protein
MKQKASKSGLGFGFGALHVTRAREIRDGCKHRSDDIKQGQEILRAVPENC